MNAPTLNAIAANDLLERRAAPLLKVYDETSFSADALSGLCAEDIGEQGRDLARTGSVLAAHAANMMRRAIDSLRDHVAAIHQMPDADGLMTTEMLLKVGRRDG